MGVVIEEALPATRSENRPAISELEKRRLAAEGWSKDSIESYRKFGHDSALLYPLIGVERGIIADGTPGTLVNVIGDTCRVFFGRPMTTDFWTWDVKPYGRKGKG